MQINPSEVTKIIKEQIKADKTGNLQEIYKKFGWNGS